MTLFFRKRILQLGNQSGVAFDPSQPAGLVQWLDYGDTTKLWTDAAMSIQVASDGDPIGGITDKSSVENHRTQATTSAKPTYRSADGGFAEFDGGDNLASTSSIDLSAGYSFFVVYRATTQRMGCIHPCLL
jgi:hypothetical protein